MASQRISSGRLWSAVVCGGLQGVGVHLVSAFFKRFFEWAVHHEYGHVVVQAELGSGAQFFAANVVA